MGRLPRRLTDNGFPDLPEVVARADQKLVEEYRQGLKRSLYQKHGDNINAKIDELQRMVEKMKNGELPADSPCRVLEGRAALFTVLTDLRLNRKLLKKEA